jgi:cell division protease FtsH
VQNLTPRRWQSSIYYLLLFIAALTLLVLFMPEGTSPKKVAITEFVTHAKQGDIDRVSQKDNTLTGYSDDTPVFTADYYGSTNDLITILADGGVKVGEGGLALEVVASGHDWALIAIQVFLPIILLAALFIFFFRSAKGAGSQAFSFGKSRARLNSPDRPQITFADVAGSEEAKEEVEEIVEFLKSPDKFQSLGGRIPRGVLLIGPPARARRCWPRPSPGRPRCRSTPSAAASSSRCSSVWVRPASATCSSRRSATRHASSSSTRSMRWAATVAPESAAGMTNVSRRSIRY